MNIVLSRDPFHDSAVRTLFREISRTGFFDYGLLIGSWPMQVYTQYFGLFFGFSTDDIDFAVKAASTKPAETIPEVLKRLEYEPITTQSGKESFVGGIYEVEFIVHRKAGNDGTAVVVKPWEVAADPLPFIDMLFIRPCKVDVTDYSITIPSPEALMLHKLIIAQRRTGINREEKKQKDLQQCGSLMEIIRVDEVQHILANYRMSKETKRSIDSSCQECGLEIPGGRPWSI